MMKELPLATKIITFLVLWPQQPSLHTSNDTSKYTSNDTSNGRLTIEDQTIADLTIVDLTIDIAICQLYDKSNDSRSNSRPNDRPITIDLTIDLSPKRLT